MSESRFRLRRLVAFGVSAVVLIIVGVVWRARMLDIHRPAVDKRRALEVEIERSGRGEILYQLAKSPSELVRPGDPSRSLSFWDYELGDRPVVSILFYRRTLTREDLDDASYFPEAGIYVWPIADQ